MTTLVQTRRDPLFMLGLVGTLAFHAAIFGALWLQRHASADDKPPLLGAFVDAQLVKFGKPRDLKFLPHKEGVIKNNEPPPDIKIAKDINAPIAKPDDKPPPDKFDPLKKTHAELFKQLRDDDRPEAVTEEGGSLTGSRAGAANEAKGDPYILSLIDRVGSAWQTPTTIKDTELANLSADVCFTIAADGQLTSYKVIRGSGNSQFDSSLEATLATIRQLPPPPDRALEGSRDRRTLRALAAAGDFCPSFSK